MSIPIAAQTKKIILAIALAAWLPSMALAMTPGQVYESVKDSVVVVKAYDRQGKQTGLGSGVMLPSGDVITNYHVVKGGVRYTVGRGKHVALGTMKAGDPDKDLCLLTIPDNAPGLTVKPGKYVLEDTLMSLLMAEPARLGKAARLKVGDPVYAVGAPQGLELSLSEGIVSQLRGGGPYPIIQTTVAISPGSSGGGLFNAKGELVGITTFYMKDGQNLNFAMPVEWIEGVAKPKKLIPYSGEVIPLKPTWLDRATTLTKAQDWSGLLAHSHRWIKAEPGNAFAWTSLGITYRQIGRHQDAIEAYREALRLKPDYTLAWNNLGNNYGDIGRHQDAIEAFREALRLKPDDATAWTNLGLSYGKLGRYKEAINAFREALRLKPDDATAWHGLAVVYGYLDNRSAALEAVKELRRYDPQGADKLFNLIMKP